MLGDYTFTVIGRPYVLNAMMDTPFASQSSLFADG